MTAATAPTAVEKGKSTAQLRSIVTSARGTSRRRLDWALCAQRAWHELNRRGQAA